MYPLERIMEKYNLSPKYIAVIDDLKPGYDMTIAAGADFYYAGWSESKTPETEGFMLAHGVTMLSSPADFLDINK